ncbi:MAG: chorismate synthase [Magnetococcus sp. WYHC-3]
MSGDSFGRLLRLTTFGESHGPAIGGVLEGCPAGLRLGEEDIQPDLDRRRPGQSRFTTQRREEDRIRILSGVYEGHTTGTAIGLMIENTDQRSRDYTAIAKRFRPGHADYTYWKKFGVRDPRGGGRSSARETAVRVAAGAIARKLLLREGVTVRGALIAMGSVTIDRGQWDWQQVENNAFFCPDAGAVPRLEALLDGIRRRGDSVGALLEVEALGVPAGWGEPVFDRLDAELAKALMSINAVKGVEVGRGMEVARLTGSDNADEMLPGPHGLPQFVSNHAGGILGGISSGAPIVLRLAVKPTSSILVDKRSVDTDGNAVLVRTDGRHDPCVGIRAVPVAEAMVLLTLGDFFLRQRSRMF